MESNQEQEAGVQPVEIVENLQVTAEIEIPETPAVSAESIAETFESKEILIL
jgi:hypothetical protein